MSDGQIVVQREEELKSFFKSSSLWEGELLPLVLEPISPEKNSVEDLVEILTLRLKEFEELLTVYGGILFRGFKVETALDFEKVAILITPNDGSEYLGISPRNIQPGCQHVFSASELPYYIPIPQHCEISFTKHPPKRIGFCCLIAPPIGGQTPLCDFRKVYQQLPDEIREKWQEKKLRMMRAYDSRSSSIPLWRFIDPFTVKTWVDVFQTNDKKKVAEICDREEYVHEWKNDHFLRLHNITNAYVEHEVTKEKVWFNHSINFDVKMAPREFQLMRNQIRLGWKSPVPSIFYWILEKYCSFIIFIKGLFLKRIDHPTYVTFGDGTPIPQREIDHVRKVVWQNKRYFDWQKGDMIFLDNRLISHGRMPYKEPRKVVVAWC